MMCSIHRSDPGVGVCAFCLREHLLILAASITADPSQELRRNPESSSPSSPLKICPQSDLPAHQSSAGNRFGGKFSLSSPSLINNAESLKSYRSPTTWLLALIRFRRMKIKSKTSPHVSLAALEAAGGRANKPRVPSLSGRGMSPEAREAMDLRSPDIWNGMEPSPSRWLSSPPPLWRKARTAATAATEATIPKYNAQKNQNTQSFSGFSLCLNPLVRPSSGNRRSRMPAEMTNCSEIRLGSGAAAGVPSFLMPNRSRKLVDFGKVW